MGKLGVPNKVEPWENFYGNEWLFGTLLETIEWRRREIIKRRDGLDGFRRETYRAIGERFGVCRQRARDLYSEGFREIRIRMRLVGYADHQKTDRYIPAWKRRLERFNYFRVRRFGADYVNH